MPCTHRNMSLDEDDGTLDPIYVHLQRQLLQGRAEVLAEPTPAPLASVAALLCPIPR